MAIPYGRGGPLRPMGGGGGLPSPPPFGPEGGAFGHHMANGRVLRTGAGAFRVQRPFGMDGRT